MRKIILILALAVSVSAQTYYSRFNYSDELPDNRDADNILIESIRNTLDHCDPCTVRVAIRYYYDETDSCFKIPDLNEEIIRVFDPLSPNGAKELERTNVVVSIGKASPAKVIGYSDVKDAGLPPKQFISEPDLFMRLKAETTAKELKEKVNNAVKSSIGKDWTAKANNKKLTEKEKRAAIWKVTLGKAKESDYSKKDKAPKVKTN